MRVVHVITGLRSGGAERLLVDYSRHTRHEMAVVALAVDGAIGDQLRARGVPVHCIGMSSNKDLRGLVRLTALLRRMAPDVVHVHLYRSLLFGRVAARLAGVRRVVATEHSAHPDHTEGRPATRGVKALYWLAEKLGDVTVAVSEETRQILCDHWGLRPDRVVVIPNGVDVERLVPAPGLRDRTRAGLGIPEGEATVVTVGRLIPGKHVDLVLLAAQELHRRTGRPATVVVVGSGPAEGDLRDLVARLDEGVHVHLVGDQPDVVPFLACADVYASASTVETYGIAIVEGYVAGLPVVYVQAPAADDLHQAAGERVHRVDLDPSSIATGLGAALQLPAGDERVDRPVLEGLDVRHLTALVDDVEQGVPA